MVTNNTIDVKNMSIEEMKLAFFEMLAQSSARFESELALSRAEWNQKCDALNKQIAETDKQIAATNKQLGGMGNSNGDFAQEFFYNALNNGTKKLFGLEFDDIMPQVRRSPKKTGIKSEYDLLMINGVAACVVEVKYKADTDDVKKILKKEASFRANFPEFSDKKLYFALASMSFDWRVEKACKDAGVAMIKQKGETIEIYDENIKTF